MADGWQCTCGPLDRRTAGEDRLHEVAVDTKLVSGNPVLDLMSSHMGSCHDQVAPDAMVRRDLTWVSGAPYVVIHAEDKPCSVMLHAAVLCGSLRCGGYALFVMACSYEM